jgi:tetratricopeptide (TPR) repeat protein
MHDTEAAVSAHYSSRRAGSMQSSRIPLLAGILAAFLALLTFQSALNAGLAFDDLIFWRDTSCWRVDTWREILSLPSIDACSYRPVRYMSLAVDYRIWGREIYGYHLTNLLLHAVTTFLVYQLIRRVIRDPRAAAIGTILWAIHPVHTDAVTYMSGRRDLLVTLFYVAALLAAPQASQSTARKWLGGLLAGLFFLLGMLSKEMAATVPATLMLMVALTPMMTAASDGIAFPSPWRPILLAVYRFFIPIVIVTGASVIFVLWAVKVGHVTQISQNIRGNSLHTHVATVMAAYGRYVELILFPMRLVGDYSAFPNATGFLDPGALLGLAFVVVIWLGGLLAVSRAPIVAFGLLFFGVTMLPVSHIIPHHELLAEHYLYLPLVGLALVVARGLEVAFAATPRRALVSLAIAALVAGGYGARVQARNREFADPVAFAARVLQAFPTSQRARLQLALEYRNRNQIEEAVRLLGQVLSLAKPGEDNFYVAHMNLANSYALLKKFDLAEEHLRQILKPYPNHPEALRVLALIRVEQGRGEEVVDILKHLCTVPRLGAQVPLDTAITLIRLGRYAEAETYAEQALSRDAENNYAIFQSGIIAMRLGNLPKAKARFERVLFFNPTDAVAMIRLAYVEGKLGNTQLADSLAHEALRLRPELAQKNHPDMEVEAARPEGSGTAAAAKQSPAPPPAPSPAVKRKPAKRRDH